MITKIGDVFAAKLDENTRKYFQFVAIDRTQLGSSVIRVFKKSYKSDTEANLAEIVKDEVEFYAHCILRVGIKHGYWEKVGKVTDVGKNEVLFRSTNDYGHILGEEPIKISKKWWVWKVNEERRYVGILAGEDTKAEIGLVISPDSIVHRMKIGDYDFAYTGFE